MNSDVGDSPDYPKANAILSDDFRYFGKHGTDDWKADAPTLKTLVEALGQGHRVNFPDSLEHELLSLKQATWRSYPDRMVLGDPLHGTGIHQTDDGEETANIVVCRGQCEHQTDEPRPKRCQPDSCS